MTKMLGKLKGGALGKLTGKKSEKSDDENDDASDEDSSDDSSEEDDDGGEKKDKNAAKGISGQAQKLLGGFTSKLGGGFGGGDLLGGLMGKKGKKSKDGDEDESSDDDDSGDKEGDDNKNEGKGSPLKNISSQAEKLLGGFTSKLGGGFGGGDLLGGLTGKKAKKSKDDGDDGDGESSDDEGDKEGDAGSSKNPLGKLTGALGGKGGDLLKGLGGGKGPGGIGGGLKDKVGDLLGGSKQDEKHYTFDWDETTEEKEAEKNEKLTEVTQPSQLKSKHAGSVFYVSMDLMRPGLVSFPMEAFNQWYTVEVRGKTELPYNNGRAARDTNIPLKVILGPDHAYLVYADKYFEYYKDQKAGAKSIPVEIEKDYSSSHDDDVFWERLVREGDAYLMDSDGNDQKPPLTFAAVKDDSFLSTLDKYLPETQYNRHSPHTRVYGVVDYPAAVRLDGGPKFLLHKIAPVIKKRIQEDEDNRKDERNFDDDVKAIPDLTHMVTQTTPVLDAPMANRLRQIMIDAYSDGDFRGITGFQDSVKFLDVQKKFDAINFNALTGIQKQIMVQRTGG